MSPDGTSFAVHQGGNVNLWKYQGTADPIDPVVTLRGSSSISPDGMFIAAVVWVVDDRQWVAFDRRMQSLTLRLFETATGKKTGEYPLGQWKLLGSTGFAYAPAFSPSGNSV